MCATWRTRVERSWGWCIRLMRIRHPFRDTQEDTPEELAADVALGKLDYMEVVGFNDYRATAWVWYRLLNLGFRIPAGAGTDAMANFASLRGPVGMDRVYARVPRGPVKIERFWTALKSGKTFATNGPLLEFSMGDARDRGRSEAGCGRRTFRFRASLRSIVPVDHWELVCYGAKTSVSRRRLFVQELKMNSSRDGGEAHGDSRDGEERVVRGAGVRADKADYPMLDNYVYATTSPIYVTVAGAKPRSSEMRNILWRGWSGRWRWLRSMRTGIRRQRRS